MRSRETQLEKSASGWEERFEGVSMILGISVDYGFDELDELAHAYAVTIHRSQGSEYPAVVIPLTTSSWMMLQRNLLYTGVTRAKKLVVLAAGLRCPVNPRSPAGPRFAGRRLS